MLMPCVSGTITIVKPAMSTQKPEKMKKSPNPSTSCKTGTNWEITIPKVQFVVVVIDTPFAPARTMSIGRVRYWSGTWAWISLGNMAVTLTLGCRKDFAAEAPNTWSPRICKAYRKHVYSSHTTATQRNTRPYVSTLVESCSEALLADR